MPHTSEQQQLPVRGRSACSAANGATSGADDGTAPSYPGTRRLVLRLGMNRVDGRAQLTPSGAVGAASTDDSSPASEQCTGVNNHSHIASITNSSSNDSDGARRGDAAQCDWPTPVAGAEWHFTVREPSRRTWLPRATYKPFQPLFRRSVLHAAIANGHTLPMIDVVIPSAALCERNPAVAQRALWGGHSGRLSGAVEERKRRFSDSSCESLSSTASQVIYATGDAARIEDADGWYTDDSDAAAIVAQHCGANARMRSALKATFEIGPGLAAYRGITLNGISSRTWAGEEAHCGYSLRLVRVSLSHGEKRKASKPRSSASGAHAMGRMLRFSSAIYGPVHGISDLAEVLCGSLSMPVVLEGARGERHVLRPAAGSVARPPQIYTIEKECGQMIHADVSWDELSWVSDGLSVRGSLLPVVGFAYRPSDTR